jgi:hypothetical protein
MERIRKSIKSVKSNDIRPFLFCVPDEFTFNSKWRTLISNSFSTLGAINLAKELNLISNLFSGECKRFDVQIYSDCTRIFHKALHILADAFDVYRESEGIQPIIICLPAKFEEVTFWTSKFNSSVNDQKISDELALLFSLY